MPGVLVARAMILENAAFNHAPARQAEWAAFTRDAFYVRTQDWRRAVLERGLKLLHQAVARSSWEDWAAEEHGALEEVPSGTSGAWNDPASFVQGEGQ